MLKIINHWKALVEHVASIIASTVTTFSKKTLEDARKIQNFLLDKNALAIVNFNLDIQFLFSKDSKEFQKRHASIVGSDGRRQNLEKGLKNLKIEHGDYFKKFLKDTYCTDSIQAANALIAQITDFPNAILPAQPCQSLTEYESKVVVYKKHVIKDK